MTDKEWKDLLKALGYGVLIGLITAALVILFFSFTN